MRGFGPRIWGLNNGSVLISGGLNNGPVSISRGLYNGSISISGGLDNGPVTISGGLYSGTYCIDLFYLSFYQTYFHSLTSMLLFL